VLSRTREGVSIITVEFEWGTQMDFANLHLREAVDRVAFREDFPEAADRPVILRWDPSSRPISILVLEGTGRLEALTEFAREVVKPALEQVDGISRAEVVGGADREILVEPDGRKMAVYGIDVEDIRRALVRSNISFPGGKVRQGPLHLSLRIDGEFEQLADIEATHVGLAGGSPVRIADVARVIDTVKEPEGATLLGGATVVSMLLYKEPEANTLIVSAALDEALSVVSNDYADFRYDFVYRDAAHVRASFEGLVQALMLGGALAVLVLFVFLGDWRSPWVVGLAIPVSIVITFGLLFFGDVKLNLMSLGGLSLAAGMLVDNSIVVLENINRHLSRMRREPPAEEAAGSPLRPTAGRRQVALAAYEGTREVARPVVAATLTTMAVFFPVVYVPGIAGAFFRDQALTVTFSLLVSIGAALLLQPVLSARILRLRQRPPRGLFRLFARALEWIHDLYHPLLVRALRRPLPLLAATLLGLVGAGIWAMNLERSFLPQRSLGDVRLDLELPAGTPLEQTTAQVAMLAEFIERQQGVRVVFSQVGQTERTLAAVQDFSAPNTARVRVILEPGRGAYERGEALRQTIAERLAGSAEIDCAFREEGIGLGEILGTGGAEFGLGVIAERPGDALESAHELLGELRRVRGLVDLQMDRVLGTTNVVVRLDREEILRRGLDPDRIARELRARVAGVEATFFNEVDQRIDIAIRLPLDERRSLPSALATSIRLDGGQTVPLSTFLVLEEQRPVRELKRRNQQRWVTIQGNLEGRSIEDVWEETEAIAARTLPGGVQIVEEGERQEMRRSFRDLGLAMVLAMLLVYMILAGQFESFLDPLLIAAVIPIGLAGAVVAIGASGGSVNVLALIGALALLGIAVNDAIVKVDTIRRLRSQGAGGSEAILEASRLRLRPILMTSATTVLAMVPMAIGLGSGEQLQRPLAVTIIGGLTLTTLLTLFVTPTLYRLAHRIERPPLER
jgi:HAE1 family hydrophobic/amphiphilic exporter-1